MVLFQDKVEMFMWSLSQRRTFVLRVLSSGCGRVEDHRRTDVVEDMVNGLVEQTCCSRHGQVETLH